MLSESRFLKSICLAVNLSELEVSAPVNAPLGLDWCAKSRANRRGAWNLGISIVMIFRASAILTVRILAFKVENGVAQVKFVAILVFEAMRRLRMFLNKFVDHPGTRIPMHVLVRNLSRALLLSWTK